MNIEQYRKGHIRCAEFYESASKYLEASAHYRAAADLMSSSGSPEFPCMPDFAYAAKLRMLCDQAEYEANRPCLNARLRSWNTSEIRGPFGI